jgi:hypothetical protein
MKLMTWDVVICIYEVTVATLFSGWQTIVDTMQRLTREVSITSFVANNLLLPAPKEEISVMLRKEEDYHFMSIQLNLLNTFLYMVLGIHLATFSWTFMSSNMCTSELVGSCA